MKVCQVASSDFTLKFMLKNQLLFLKRQGYVVHAVCSPGKWVGDIEQSGIPVKTIKFKRSISPFYDVVTLWNLYRYFKKEQFDIVHTHTFKPDLYGQIAARWAGVPIVIRTSHGFPFGVTSSNTKKSLYLWLEKFLNMYSDVIFSIAHHIIDTSVKEKIAPREKLVYLGRDIDTQKFNPERFSLEVVTKKKKELGIPENKTVIGIVARLVEEKGYLELFAAYKEVVTQFPETVLLVIGPHEPEKRDALDLSVTKTYRIEKNVIFLGEQKNTDELYPLMDIFVLPTHMEGLGASILEASAFEKPVIASNTGGIPETMEDQKTGILVPVKNVQKLADAIIYLLRNPEAGKNMGREGRKKVVREFDTKVVLARLGEGYKEVIQKKHGNI